MPIFWTHVHGLAGAISVHVVRPAHPRRTRHHVAVVRPLQSVRQAAVYVVEVFIPRRDTPHRLRLEGDAPQRIPPVHDGQKARGVLITVLLLQLPVLRVQVVGLQPGDVAPVQVRRRGVQCQRQGPHLRQQAIRVAVAVCDGVARHRLRVRTQLPVVAEGYAAGDGACPVHRVYHYGAVDEAQLLVVDALAGTYQLVVGGGVAESVGL